MRKLRVGILGATGMVGQRFIQLLNQHPWFEVSVVAASSKSAGKTYVDAVKNRWKMDIRLPFSIKSFIIRSVVDDKEKIAQEVDFVFCALDLDKNTIQTIEESYAALGVPVVSNNSANRWIDDIPMIIPEVNGDHIRLIDYQKKKRGWKKGFIVVKPNCSIQSYVPILAAWKKFKPKEVQVTNLQAISGAGKNFENWPEMVDNVIPFIGGEEEKSEKEPLKILGELAKKEISLAVQPEILATCIRVPVTDGHIANVSLTFIEKPSTKELLQAIRDFNNNNFLTKLDLPSSPDPMIRYLSEENRPQTKIDRNYQNGMGISVGRLRQINNGQYGFVSLSHNTIRGAAGGAILTAELLVKKGYIA